MTNMATAQSLAAPSTVGFVVLPILRSPTLLGQNVKFRARVTLFLLSGDS